MKGLKTIDNYGKYGNYDNWKAAQKDDNPRYDESYDELREDMERARYYMLMSNPFC